MINTQHPLQNGFVIAFQLEQCLEPKIADGLSESRNSSAQWMCTYDECVWFEHKAYKAAFILLDHLHQSIPHIKNQNEYRNFKIMWNCALCCWFVVKMLFTRQSKSYMAATPVFMWFVESNIFSYICVIANSQLKIEKVCYMCSAWNR